MQDKKQEVVNHIKNSIKVIQEFIGDKALEFNNPVSLLESLPFKRNLGKTKVNDETVGVFRTDTEKKVVYFVRLNKTTEENLNDDLVGFIYSLIQEEKEEQQAEQEHSKMLAKTLFN
jgi:hypothetical protein